MKKLRITALATIIALSLGTLAVAAEPASSVAVTRRIDINTATEAQLKATLGVGDQDAKKIIAGRPYTKKEQLKTKNIIPADSYAKIKKLIDAVC
jgi:competence protein ComEA